MPTAAWEDVVCMAQDGPSPPSSAYRLEELGWLQFERLCALVLEAESGVDVPRWSGHADAARVTVLEQPLALTAFGLSLPAPLAVAVIWVRAGPEPHHRLALLAGGASTI